MRVVTAHGTAPLKWNRTRQTPPVPEVPGMLYGKKESASDSKLENNLFKIRR